MERSGGVGDEDEEEEEVMGEYRREMEGTGLVVVEDKDGGRVYLIGDPGGTPLPKA